MSAQGDGDYYVGSKVIRCKEAGIVLLHQTRYITEVLKWFHRIDCNPVSTPADPHVHLSIQSDDAECNGPISVPYKEAIGCLMFTSLLTRPDILYAVHMALQESMEYTLNNQEKPEDHIM